MRQITMAIHENEKAWSLREVNLVRPPSNQWHRYQIVTVVRADQLAEWWHDLGPMDRFNAPGLEIPSLFEHSVAELRDIAQDSRLRDNYWQNRAAEIAAESVMIPDFLEQLEENWKVIRNQSVFGPGGSKQRNGFPLAEALGRN